MNKPPDIFITRNQTVIMRNGPALLPGERYFEEPYAHPINLTRVAEAFANPDAEINFSRITWELAEPEPYRTSHGIRVFREV